MASPNNGQLQGPYFQRQARAEVPGGHALKRGHGSAHQEAILGGGEPTPRVAQLLRGCGKTDPSPCPQELSHADGTQSREGRCLRQSRGVRAERLPGRGYPVCSPPRPPAQPPFKTRDGSTDA